MRASSKPGAFCWSPAKTKPLQRTCKPSAPDSTVIKLASGAYVFSNVYTRKENCKFSKVTEGSGKSKLNLKKLFPRGGMHTSAVFVRGRMAEDSGGLGLAGTNADSAAAGCEEILGKRAAVVTPATVFLSKSRREILSSMSAPFRKRAEESETQKVGRCQGISASACTTRPQRHSKASLRAQPQCASSGLESSCPLLDLSPVGYFFRPVGPVGNVRAGARDAV